MSGQCLEEYTDGKRNDRHQKEEKFSLKCREMQQTEGRNESRLREQALAVNEMVQQMKNAALDWEEDLNDPFERAIATKDSSEGEKKMNNPQANRRKCHQRNYEMNSPRNSPRNDSHFKRSNSLEKTRGRGRSQGRYNMKQSFHRHDQYPDDGKSNLGYSSDSASHHSFNAKDQEAKRGNYGNSNNGQGYRNNNNDNNFSQSPKGNQGPGIRPWHLVEYLAECPEFQATILQLMEWRNLSPSAIRETALMHPKVLKVNGEVVKLHPEINICSAHSSAQGCLNRSSCRELHICHIYVTSWCRDQKCVLGHRWHTNHNDVVLRAFHIERLPPPSLRKLLQICIFSSGPVGQLTICSKYNSTGCNNDDCDALHVCQSFVTGLTKCTLPKCQLNHDLLTPECTHLLAAHRISVNEAPRDIVLSILDAYPSVRSSGNTSSVTAANISVSHKQSGQGNGLTEVNNTASNNSQASDRNGGHSSSGQEPSRNVPSSSNNRDKDSSSVGDNGHANSGSGAISKVVPTNRKKEVADKDTSPNHLTPRGQTKDPSQQKRRKTVWSHFLQGDTNIDEICFYSVESTCRNEATGCTRLHATDHFHWQVSEDGVRWLNLRQFQVTALEISFCDPFQEGLDIPRLDPSKLNTSLNHLLTVLGRDKWRAHFQAMIITNSDQSRVLYLRRLHTEFIDGLSIKAREFCWYFLDKNKKWVEYGKVDTAGEVNLVSSVKSDDIEKHYQKNESRPLSFQNASYTYVLDFVSMYQTNQGTKVRREVRRRPKPHLKDKSQFLGQNSSNARSSSGSPSSWDPMQREERVRTVPLVQTSTEYQTVSGLVTSQAPNLMIMKIERIQNPYLWRAFQNKIEEMKNVYGDIKKVDVRQLFHGTRSDVVASIIAENFDWRLHGTRSGQAAGRGTYFSSMASTSIGYCDPGHSGMRCLFIARVAVGSITQGNSSMSRPPINPATGAPYDSTGDGVNVIVKYDKQEYYPEYIIWFQ